MDDQNPTQDPQSGANDDTTSPNLTTVQAELESTKTRLAELTQISQQALADLQNFKKRTEEDKIKFVAFANSTLISELLPVLDNIDRSLAHLPEDPAAREWANGILAIMKQMDDVLKARGLEKIETAGLTFDPNLHEAVMTEAGLKDQIIRELEKGYKLSDRVLRRAKVTVGNTAAEAAPEIPQADLSTLSSTPEDLAIPSEETSADPYA